MPIRVVALVLVLVLVLVSSVAQAADTVSGPARATAPETLVVANVRIRFTGFTAPASDARCGEAACAEKAVARLAELAATGPVTCTRGARAGHGVYSGTCRLADGRDPARVLAEEGLLRPEP
jgi:endonuclease YncB( thermonuclease family)